MNHLSRFFLCALLLLSTWQVSLCQDSAKPTDKPLNQPGEDANFQRYLSSGRTSVVAFYANWCPSCRSWAPFLDAVNTHFPDMQVLFMDIGEWDTPVTEKYGIQSVPHFKIYNGSGGLIVEGSSADDWLKQAIAQRLEARARGKYRLAGDVARVNLGNASRSVTLRPRGGVTTTAKARTTNAAPARREKIESTGPLPSVDQVIDRYVAALGATPAAANFRTRVASGKVHVSALGRGTFTSHSKAPNKVAVTVDIPEVGVIRQGFNGTTGWIQNPRTGVRAATNAELAMLKREAEFNNFCNLKTRFPKMKLLGVSKIGYREAYVIEAKPPTGHSEQLYFSKDNGLLIRWDAVLVAGNAGSTAEIYLDDWTEVDGLKIPFTVTQLLPRFSVVFSFNEVKHDIEVSDAVFNRPGSR